MENAIDTRKVNRSLFAWRVVDIHNDEFGFAQNDVIYTYVTDSTSKAKGTTWLRMQKTGEKGPDRRKYFLFFGDETESCAYVDKHNDVYDYEKNYVCSLVRSKFILFLFLFIAGVILLTGLAMYLGGTMIMNTTSPFYEDKTIHLDDTDDKGGKGSETVDIDIFEPVEEKNKEEQKAPINDAKQEIEKIKEETKDEPAEEKDNLADARQAAIDAIRRAQKAAKDAIDASEDLTDAQKRELKARIDDEAEAAISNIEKASTLKEIISARDDGLDEIADVLDDAIALEFVNKYCSGDDNDPYDKRDDKVTKDNAAQIISGQRDYDDLTDEQRKKVNELIYTPTGPEDKKGYDKGDDTYKNYPEMLRDAKEALNNAAHGSFINKKKDRLVWPGQGDRFVFYVQNDGKKILNYTLTFADSNPDNIPLRFKVLVDDEYIAGGDGNNWVTTATLQDVTRTIEPGDIVQYKIIWEWPDDGTQDSRDTQMGVDAQSRTIKYELEATCYFEEVV